MIDGSKHGWEIVVVQASRIHRSVF